MKSRFAIDRHQATVLTERYLDVMLGDIGATVLLILQAPLIAALVSGVWANASKDTLTLYFVLCLSAFFLGAVNSAREIVKERALFLRERLLGLSLGAYLASKYRVLLILVALQCVIMAAIVRAYVPLTVNVFAVTAVLLLSATAGTAVGLAISAFVDSPDKAVAAVPIVVIPQILFSDFVLGEGQLDNWAGHAEKLMPVRWTYDVLRELYRSDWSLAEVVLPVMVVLAMIAACFGVSLLLLSRGEG